MNPDIKKRWTDALRTGGFAQTTGLLHVKRADGSDAYCCLGVLCELAVDAGVCESAPRDNPAEGTPVMYGNGNAKNDSVLPNVVMEWAGLDSCDPELIPETGHSASGMNDSLGASFAEIADAIDKEL